MRPPKRTSSSSAGRTGVACPHCGSTNVQSGTKHKTMPYRCREKECAKRFSAKTGTVMEGSKLGLQVWMIATFLLSTNLKSVSSMKLHRDLEITQKSAWFLAHRLRRALDRDGDMFAGPVEVDETYMGGKRKNMSNAKRKELAGTGRGAVGKVAVVGIKDRETKHVRAKVVEATDKATLQGFVVEHTAPGGGLHRRGVRLRRAPVPARKRQARRLGVRSRDAHTNGAESFWSMLKRAHMGTFHKMSPKHLDRYVTEFAGRQNVRENDTIDQLGAMVHGMEGKRLTYDELTASNGLDSGARSLAPRSGSG